MQSDIPQKLNGRERSPQWRGVRNKFIKGKPCALCGGMKRREVHHIKPFHEYPELELVIKNLLVLCEDKKTVNCHLIFGHLGNYKKHNPNVLRDVRYFGPLIRAKA